MPSARLGFCVILAAAFVCGCSGDGADEGGRVIEAQPSDNVRAMIEALEPGDTLILHDGTYDVKTAGTRFLFKNIHGTPSNWITVRAADGARPVLQGQSHNNIEFLNSSYIRISGFDLVNGSDGIKISHSDEGPTHNIRFEDLKVKDLFGNGFGIQAAASEIHVDRCEFSGAESGLYWGKPDGTGSLTNSSLRNSYIHDCGRSDGTGYGIQIKNPGRGNVIEDNVFVRVAGSTRAAIALYWNDSDDPADSNVVRRNVIWDVPRYGGTDTTTAAIWLVAGARVENNIIFNAGHGIEVMARDGVYPKNVQVLNNTIFSCRYGGIKLGEAADMADPQVIAASNAVFRGSFAAWSYQAFLGSQTRWVLEDNVIGYLPAAELAFASTTFGDPNFLYPTASGWLFGSGSLTYHAEEDFNRTPRPRDGRSEAGAYEFTKDENPGWTIGEELKEFPDELKKFAPSRSSGCVPTAMENTAVAALMACLAICLALRMPQ